MIRSIMSRKNLFVIIGVCLVGAIIVLAINRYSLKTQASGGTEMFQVIDNKALIAQNGQQAAVSDLVDTIFIENGAGDLNSTLAASLKDRIVRAEMNGHTINETQVVQAINWLANELSAPSFAQTSQLQTRVSRLELNEYIPNLFVNKDSQGNKTTNRPLNSDLATQISPSEGVCLSLILIQQKMLNQDFQLTPTEWESKFHLSQQSLPDNTSTPGSSEQGLSRKTNTQKTDQMYQLIANSNLSSADVDRLAHGVLDNLGIPR